MNPQTLVWAPAVFAGAFIVAGLAVEPAALSTVLRVANESGKVLSAVGCLAAALAFERGDYLRRAWLFSAGCMLLLLLRDASQIPGWAGLTTAQGMLVVLANASSVIGAWLLARVWSEAGLDEDVTARRWTLSAAGVVVSLLVTGWPLGHDLRLLLGGDLGAIQWVASDLGDTLVFALIAPVLQTAIALRGGSLLWPWALLTAGGFCWLLYDAVWGFGELLHVDGERGVRIAVESMRGLACTFTAMAGIAQRMVVRRAAGG